MSFTVQMKNRKGQVIAQIEKTSVKDMLSTASKAIIDGLEYVRIVLEALHGKKTTTGWVKSSDLSEFDTASVQIPANFAGLEAVAVPTRLMDQYFDITEVVENENYVEITAEHMFYRLNRNYTEWKPTEDTNYTGAAACRNIMVSAVSEPDFFVASDCTDTKPGSELDYERKSIVEALLDPDNGLCAKYGLSLIRDNDVFYCLKNVGYDRGIVIEDKKNMLGVERTETLETTVTRVAPFGKTKKGDIIWLDNNGVKYVDSQYIDDYPYPMIELLDTGLQVGTDDVTEDNIQAKLLEAAQKRFSEDHADLPNVTMRVEFVSLGDTEEYAQYRDLDKVYLYDIITIKDSVRGYNYSAQVIGVEHDILTGALNSVTIGKLEEWDGTRKIAAWQVPEVSGENIRLKSIMAGTFAPGAINGDDISAGAIQYLHIASATIDDLNAAAITAITANIQTIIAGKVVADSIDANAITAINAKLGVADIADAEIANASIGFAQIKAATAESLIARDAVTDRYYIRKLAVDSAQFTYATVGELIIKATDNHYYRLDVDANGAISPTDVTSSLSSGEIAAGVTSDGHSAIIETDLTVTDLSASTMKAISALIDKITASRIDVDELWARQAFINKLMVQDISSNTYIQSTIGNWVSGSTITQTINSLDSRISSLGYGTVYMQPEEPSHSELVPGDIWIQTQASGTWEQVYQDYSTWQDIYNNVSTWQTLGGVSIMWVWDGRKWQKQLDALDSDTFETEIQQNATNIQLLANRTTTVEGELGNKYTIQSGILIEAAGIKVSGARYVIIESGGYFQVQTGNFGIDTDSSTYVIWSGASTAANSPFSVKKDGTLKATSGEIGGWALAANSLSSGSGTTYVNINSNSSNTYSIWAGAEAATNAPFRLKRDGSVYLTKLIAIGEGGSETTVDLHNYGLWKLNYATVKSVTVSGNTLTITTTAGTTTFSKAAPILTGSWSGGAYTVSVSNYPEVTPNSSGAVNLSFIGQGSGGSSVAKIRAYTSGAIVNDYDVDCPLIYKNGWNEAVSSMYVLGTVYRITAHSGEWVKVQEVGTGYSNPGPI